MATFTGYILLDIITAVSKDRPPWYELIDYRNFGTLFLPDFIDNTGTRTYNPSSSLPDNTYTGYIAGSYAEVFYNRILIEPIYLDFGSVISSQEQNITVFNAYLSDRILQDIVLTGFDAGISLQADTTPETYLPLEERTHVLTVTPDGPPNIDASIFYDWEGASDDISVNFIGTRIVLLQLTMRPGVKEKLVWLTNVMTSRNGTEQRVRHRNAPRQQFSFQAYANKDDRNLIENLLYGRIGQQAALPVWTENRYGDPITSGDTVISVSTLYGDFRLGELALIWESSRKFHAFQIDEITDTSLVTVKGVPQSFDSPIIMPIRTIRFLNDPTRNATGYDAVVTLNVEATDNIRLDTTASAIQINGEDFYDEEPLMANMNGVPDKYNTRIDLIDYDTGVIGQIAPWIYNRVTREFNLILEGLEDIWNFRLWLHRRAGRLVPFYMPTFENNITILSRGILTDTLSCRNDLYSSQSISRSRLAIKKKDGSWVFRVVLNAYVDELGNDIIELDSALDFNWEEIAYVSYLGLKRLSSDSFEMTWLPNNVVTVSVPITEIAS